MAPMHKTSMGMVASVARSMQRQEAQQETQPTQDALPKSLPCYHCAEHHSDAEPCAERPLSAPHPVAAAMVDLVNHPSHYTSGKIETWDFIVDKGLNFLRGNVVKYLVRAGIKDANTELQDLEKARAYLDREIQRIKGL